MRLFRPGTTAAWAVVGALAPSVAPAQPISADSVPESLRRWTAWALDGAEDRLCAASGDAVACLWPGRLALAVGGQGGTFTLDVFADHALDLSLPGGKQWPQDVLVDGKPAAVLDKDQKPLVRLTGGSHRLTGRFTWERLPDALAVPPSVGIVDLTVDGRAVALPRRDESGLLILRQGGGAAAAGENLRLQVFRKVRDGIPLWVETRVAFEVSGKAREIALVGSLLDSAAPVAVSGDLPARLDADRKLRVQVRAGSFTVTVVGRLAGRGETLTRPKTAAPWPTQEVWVFEAAERYRQVETSGAPPIDPSRTDLPEEWRTLPAFLIEGTTTLALREVRRGVPDAAPDQVSLMRQLWLDEGGGGFTVRDQFSGRLGRSTRLNAAAPADLGRVAVDGAGQLVTRDPGTGAPGVELRQAAVNIEADARVPRQASLPAVGWNVNVQSLRAELLLPPGWRLLGARGVDQAPDSWTSRWNLFGFFFVLLTALAVGRVVDRRWGALALVTLVLLHGEDDAPRLAWLSLVGALALAAAAPRPFLKTLARVWCALSLLVLVWALVPFAVDQVRTGLFPQVAERGGPQREYGGVLGGEMAKPAPRAPAPPPPATVVTQNAPTKLTTEDAERLKSLGYVEGGKPGKRGKEEQYASNALSFYDKTAAYQQDPHAVIQTGAGIPNWSWESHSLGWSGPVAQEHHMQLLLLSPGGNLVLALLRVALATLLALRLTAVLVPTLGRRLPWTAPPAAPAIGVGLAIVALLLPIGARAQEQQEEQKPARGGAGIFPGQDLLDELRTRLTRPPACAPHCVTTARLKMTVDGGLLRFEAEVHAGALGSWPIPGPAESWVPQGVSVDGAASEGRLARLADGFLHVRVAPGVHHVVVSGPLPPKDSLTLQFGATPHAAAAVTPGWQVDGIRDDGTADASVQLSRRLGAGGVPDASSGGGYEPWLEVTRVLDIGVSWSVETTVKRVSPVGAPVVVKVPLLKNMIVTDGERQQKDGELLVTLGRDETETGWSATLKPVEGEPVTLKAAEGRPWSEVWTVHCGFVWQCDASGLPPVLRVQDGRLAPEYRPWPGESLTLALRRPKGFEGQTLTIDRVSLQLSPGTRLEDATLDLQVRASRPGPLTVTLPSDAEVRELKVKGVERPIRPDRGALTVSLDAGDQPVRVGWRQSGGLGLVHRAPAVSLGHPAVNVEISTALPPERWLLLTGGPSWGPHVLFWGYLLLVVLAALVLARVPASPLTAVEWALLALGLTQLPIAGAVLVAGWFLVLGWRRDRVLRRPWAHDVLQLGLALWTLVALAFLYAAVHEGLLLRPDMLVAGRNSTETLLVWYRDRVDGALPRPWVVSVPLVVYRLAMLAWSLWLALRLVRWLPWAWASATSGSLWQPLRRPPTAKETPPTAPAAG